MLKKIIISILRIFLRIIYRPTVLGAEHLDLEGGYVLTANHRSNWDVLVLYSFLKKDLFFMSKAELFKNRFVGWFLKQFGAFPVKRGTNDLAAIKHSIHILNDGKILGIFPQGKRTDNLNVDDAKAGAVLFASRCKKPVIPVAISGEYKLGAKICINVGSPIYFPEQKLSPEELSLNTVAVMEKIKELSESV